MGHPVYHHTHLLRGAQCILEKLPCLPSQQNHVTKISIFCDLGKTGQIRGSVWLSRYLLLLKLWIIYLSQEAVVCWSFREKLIQLKRIVDFNIYERNIKILKASCAWVRMRFNLDKLIWTLSWQIAHFQPRYIQIGANRNCKHGLKHDLRSFFFYTFFFHWKMQHLHKFVWWYC